MYMNRNVVAGDEWRMRAEAAEAKAVELTQIVTVGENDPVGVRTLLRDPAFRGDRMIFLSAALKAMPVAIARDNDRVLDALIEAVESEAYDWRGSAGYLSADLSQASLLGQAAQAFALRSAVILMRERLQPEAEDLHMLLDGRRVVPTADEAVGREIAGLYMRSGADPLALGRRRVSPYRRALNEAAQQAEAPVLCEIIETGAQQADRPEAVSLRTSRRSAWARRWLGLKTLGF